MSFAQAIYPGAGTYDVPPNGHEPEPGWFLIMWGTLALILLLWANANGI